MIRMSFILMALAVAGCATRPPPAVRVIAEIVQFTPQAHHMDWDGGRWATYDVVQFRILSPAELAGKPLAVSIHPVNPNTFLREKGTHCSFSILRELVTASEQTHRDICEGALQDLRSEN